MGGILEVGRRVEIEMWWGRSEGRDEWGEIPSAGARAVLHVRYVSSVSEVELDTHVRYAGYVSVRI